MKYTIYFTDGGTLGHIGTIKVMDNIIYFYEKDSFVRLIIPIEKN